MNFEDAIAAQFAPLKDFAVMDGKVHRFATNQSKPQKKDGWYIGFDDATGRAGVFGSWRDGSKHSWSNGTGRKLTADEHKKIDEAKEASYREAQAAAAATAKLAKDVYAKAATAGISDYLARKGIKTPAGVRFLTDIHSTALGFKKSWNIKAAIIVPMRDATGDIKSLQLIVDGFDRKLFLKNGRTSGLFHVLGGDLATASRIIVAEGIATAQSIYEVTRAVVVIAFSAGNLEDVAIAIRKINAKADIIFAADGDDAGRAGAADAAKACGGCVITAPDDKDFNDVPIELPEDTLWRAGLIVKSYEDGSQKILCRTHNIMLILAHAPEFRGTVEFDEFAKDITIGGDPLNDAMAIRIKAQIEKDWISDKVSTAEVHEALSAVADAHLYHPVRQYLDALHWDGVGRIQTFFTDFCAAPADAYHQQTAQSFFISSVARVMAPGCQVDTMVVLEGQQGSKKSSLWKTLFGKWYADITTNINDKDFFIGLRGVWGADLGELDQFSKAESSRIKQVITIREDHYRLPYARTSSKVMRQSVFVGNTNNDDYLKDPTGARRILPVKVGCSMIDTDAVAAIRDQLWAEAVVRYNKREKWWDIEGAESRQAERYQDDSWAQPIREYLLGRNETTMTEILTHALQIDLGQHSEKDQMRVGKILTRMQVWSKKRARVGKDLIYKYIREDNGEFT